MKQYTREELTAICEKAIVPHAKWDNRDSLANHMNVAKCWMLLKAGCKFEVRTKENSKSLITDDDTIWINFWAKNFAWFENLLDDDEYPEGYRHEDSGSGELMYYLPTEKCLKEANGGSWS